MTKGQKELLKSLDALKTSIMVLQNHLRGNKGLFIKSDKEINAIKVSLIKQHHNLHLMIFHKLYKEAKND